MKLLENSIWRYVGPGCGQGELQRVIFIECGLVTSIGANHAFHGSASRFVNEFEFVHPGP